MIGRKVVFDTKYAESNDVMNIELSPEFLFRYAATLTLVVVSFARLASLVLPVIAVVINVSSSPTRRFVATYRGGMKSRRAFLTAKSSLGASGGFRCVWLTALRTGFWNLIMKRIVLTLVVLGIAYCGAFGIAVVVLAASYFSGWALKCLSASIAGDANKFDRVSAIALNGLALAQRPLVGAATRGGAVLMLVAPKEIGRTFNAIPAVRARYLDPGFWCSHKKHLLLVVDRVLVEGIRTLTRGVANNSRLHTSSQQTYALDLSIVPQLQGII